MGRSVPIPWVVPQEQTDKGLDFSTMIGDMMGKDPSGGSVMALGLGPYVSTMIFVQIIASIGSKDKKRDKNTIRRITMIIAILVGVLQAYVQTADMEFKNYGAGLLETTAPRILTIIALVTGCFVVIALSENNMEKGFGGMSTFILVNMLTNVRTLVIEVYRKITESGKPDLIMILITFAVVMLLLLVTILFEKSELRLELYRIMIHNDLSDAGYIAIKLNPSGTMPAMFAMTFFLIPIYLVKGLGLLFPHVSWIARAEKMLDLNTVSGVVLYCLVVILLTYGFAGIFVDAKQITKNFRESGDCIAGVRPGKDTLKAVKKSVHFCCFFSALMQSVCVCGPLLIAALHHDSSRLYSAPMTIMILTGISLTLINEAEVLRMFKDYKPFI